MVSTVMIGAEIVDYTLGEPQRPWEWALIGVSTALLVAVSAAVDTAEARRTDRAVPCIGCGTETIRYLWIDMAAADTDPWTADISGVCDPCRVEQVCDVHVRLPEPCVVTPHDVRWTVVRHIRVMQCIAARRARTAWTRQFTTRPRQEIPA